MKYLSLWHRATPSWWNREIKAEHNPRKGDRDEISAHQNWIVYSCLVVLLLMVSAQLRDAFEKSRPVAESYKNIAVDLRIYYVAGLVLRQDPTKRLYYPDRARYPGSSSRDIFANADPQSGWGEATRRAGLGTTTMQFFYPPVAAVLLEPLSFLPFHAAFFVWRIVSVLFVLLSIFFALRLVNAEPFPVVFVVCAAAAQSFAPVYQTLDFGQLGAAILFTWTMGTYHISRGRPVWSAIFFSLATIMKVTPLIVVPLFILRRQWKWLGAYACSAAVLLAVEMGSS